MSVKGSGPPNVQIKDNSTTPIKSVQTSTAIQCLNVQEIAAMRYVRHVLQHHQKKFHTPVCVLHLRL